MSRDPGWLMVIAYLTNGSNSTLVLSGKRDGLQLFIFIWNERKAHGFWCWCLDQDPICVFPRTWHSICCWLRKVIHQKCKEQLHSTTSQASHSSLDYGYNHTMTSWLVMAYLNIKTHCRSDGGMIYRSLSKTCLWLTVGMYTRAIRRCRATHYV